MTDNDFDREVQEIIAGWRAGLSEQDIREGRESLAKGEGRTLEQVEALINRQIAAHYNLTDEEIAAVNAATGNDEDEDFSMDEVELDIATQIVRYSRIYDKAIAAIVGHGMGVITTETMAPLVGAAGITQEELHGSFLASYRFQPRHELSHEDVETLKKDVDHLIHIFRRNNLNFRDTLDIQAKLQVGEGYTMENAFAELERRSPLTDEEITAANEAWEASKGQPTYSMEKVFKEFEPGKK